MEGKLLSIPKLTSDVKVFWGTENQAISTTTADFGELQLTPFRLNAIIYSSRELFDDSALSILEILRRRFVDRVRDEENKQFITGNGSGKPKGIDAETLRLVNAGNSLSPDHITNAYWKLGSVFRRNGRWLINSRTIAYLENKKDSNGAYLYPSLQAEVPTLKGRPILVDDYVPSTKVFYGDLSYYYIGDRQQVTMEVTTEGGNTWEKHQVGLKLIERVDGEVALTDAFVEISNTGVS
jgi:HK97 family phage major capsid protein